jgi:branched-chain amino acid transport system ATP-binding protein
VPAKTTLSCRHPRPRRRKRHHLHRRVDITRLPRHQIVHHGIARTFQNIELFERATVLENLLLGRHRYPAGNLFSQLLFTPAVRRAEVAAREKAEDIIELLELQPYRHAPVSGLPYGVRKVVELGRALATDPRLLLLDEPASGLNPEETRDLSFWIEDMEA